MVPSSSVSSSLVPKPGNSIALRKSGGNRHSSDLGNENGPGGKESRKVKGKLQKDSGFAWEVDYGALTPQVSKTLGISGYFSITESSRLTVKLHILGFTHPPSWVDVLHPVGRELGGVMSDTKTPSDTRMQTLEILSPQ